MGRAARDTPAPTHAPDPREQDPDPLPALAPAGEWSLTGGSWHAART